MAMGIGVVWSHGNFPFVHFLAQNLGFGLIFCIRVGYNLCIIHK